MKKISRGQIWYVELNPTRGAEIHKERPCVVVSSDVIGKLPLKLVVPITGWDDRYENSPWHVKLEPDSLNCLDKPSTADAYQVRSVAVERFTTCKGVVSPEQLADIVAAIGIVIEIT
ncbi:MAG: type II toxin-antitoxin system PemK/MazF family toxin [Dethiobacter sp.]|jgi:mRNA interferase MazF|nr:MAG: type II toxin-antitoxin system PemK/MazF family toxin [Dethiobacter sp.]